jgi:hypothetical protein
MPDKAPFDCGHEWAATGEPNGSPTVALIGKRPAFAKATAGNFTWIESEGWCGREDSNLHWIAPTSS